MKFTFDYMPTEKQRLFHTAQEDEVLYGGAAGGGKSKAIVMDAVMRCSYFKNARAYLFRRTYKELEDTLIKEAQASIPPGYGSYSNASHDWSLPNGSKLCFRHCKNETDRFNYQGAEIDFLYIDELTSFPKIIVDYLKTRVRSKSNSGIRPCIRYASNPGNIGHGWVKQKFIDVGHYNETIVMKEYSDVLKTNRQYTIKYIPALLTDNPHLQKDYVFELERKPAALRDALLYGNWDAFEGQVFMEWKDDPANYDTGIETHVIDPIEIPMHWPRYMGFDYGYAKPFSVGWWAIDEYGRMYRYREWYGSTGEPDVGLCLTPREIAEGIIQREALERKNNIQIIRIADPSIFDRSRGKSVADQMKPNMSMGVQGVVFIPGDNNRMAGKMEFHQRLKIEDKTKKPMLYVFKTCKDFIRTIPTLPYSQKNIEDIDTAAEDHIYDEARYVMMYNPMKAKLVAKSVSREYNPFEV